MQIKFIRIEIHTTLTYLSNLPCGYKGPPSRQQDPNAPKNDTTNHHRPEQFRTNNFVVIVTHPSLSLTIDYSKNAGGGVGVKKNSQQTHPNSTHPKNFVLTNEGWTSFEIAHNIAVILTSTYISSDSKNTITRW